MSIQTSVSQAPCYASTSYQITATGGTPTYSYQVAPPSPPGTIVSSTGLVSVPASAQPGDEIKIKLRDSGQPQDKGVSNNNVGVPPTPPPSN